MSIKIKLVYISQKKLNTLLTNNLTQMNSQLEKNPYILTDKINIGTKVWVLCPFDDWGDLGYHWNQATVISLAPKVYIDGIKLTPWIKVILPFKILDDTRQELQIYMYPEERLYANEPIITDIYDEECGVKDIECIAFDKSVLEPKPSHIEPTTGLVYYPHSGPLSKKQIIKNHLFLSQ